MASSIPYVTEAPGEPIAQIPDGQQDSVQRGKEIIKDIIQTLEQHTSIDCSEVDQLLRRARQAGCSPFKDVRTIAVQGDTGQGKSSLINSLLGYPGLAKTSGWTMGCTTVATEFIAKVDNSPAPFRLEIDFLTAPEREKMIEELVYSYRRRALPSIPSAERDNAEGDDDDRERIENESKIAWSSLQTAFQHKTALQDLCDTEDVHASQMIVDQLLEWTNEIEWPEGCVDGRWKKDLHVASKVCREIDVLRKNNIWPFVKVTRVYLHSQILESGVILVDLPGQRDVNLARVKLSEEYLLHADHTFIVVDIKRAASNESLKMALLSEINKELDTNTGPDGRRHLDATIICTHAEAMDVDEAIDDVAMYAGKERLTQIEGFENQIQEAQESGDVDMEGRYKRALKSCLMDARNKFVQQQIKQTYAQELAGCHMEVFCVGNAYYKESVLSQDFSKAHESGIPRLREYCKSIAIEAAASEAKNFLTTELPSLLKSIELWLGSLSNECNQLAKYHDHREERLKESETQFKEAVEEAHADLTKLFEEQIMSPMATRGKLWEMAAFDRSEEWRMWHHRSYDAWCRHDGTWRSHKRGNVRWNAELNHSHKRDMRVQWTALGKGTSKVVRKTAMTVRKILTRLSDTFTRETPEFRRAVKYHRDTIAHWMKVIDRLALKQVKVLRRRALEDGKSSLLLDRMRPAYRKAAKEPYCPGYNQRQLDIMRKHMEGGIFQGVLKNIDVRMANLTEYGCNNLRTTIADSVKAIGRDFGLTYGAADKAVAVPDEVKEGLILKFNEWKEEYADVFEGFQRANMAQTPALLPSP